MKDADNPKFTPFGIFLQEDHWTRYMKILEEQNPRHKLSYDNGRIS